MQNDLPPANYFENLEIIINFAWPKGLSVCNKKLNIHLLHHITHYYSKCLINSLFSGLDLQHIYEL